MFFLQIVTDYVFLCPARLSARSGVRAGGSVWLYVFDHAPSDPKIWAGLPFCYNRTCHGAELPFLFDSAPSTNFTLTPQESLLANRMACYWGAFAHTGDPNSPSEQTGFCRKQRLAVWPRYTATEGWPILNLTLQAHPQHGDRDHFCDFWDRLDIYWGEEFELGERHTRSWFWPHLSNILQFWQTFESTHTYIVSDRLKNFMF